MMNESITGKFRRMVGDLNEGRLEEVKTTLASNFYMHTPDAGEPTQSKVFFDILTELKAAFSDLQLNVHELNANSGRLRGQITLVGTHDGALWGAPPSGKRVQWPIEVAARAEADGFAVSIENPSLPDIMALLRQVNLVPPPEQMDQPPRYPVSIPEILLKLVFTGQVSDKPCHHLDQIKVVEPDRNVCLECQSLGDVWPALRMCLICGYVGCCDTSKNKHMKQHYESTGHPLFRSIRMDEGWIWCYEDNAFFSKRRLGGH